MSLPLAYREEYYSRLEKCLDIVELNGKFIARQAEYESLKAEINARLCALDAITGNAEDLIDGSSGKLKRGAELAVNGDSELLHMLNTLAAMKQELSAYGATHRWDDGVMNNVDVILAIASYEDMEKMMHRELGRDMAECIIYEEKKRIVTVERERGIRFFADEVEMMDALFRIRVLFPTVTELSLDRSDNADTLDVELTNGMGETIRFRKSGQITYGKAMYVELILLDDMRIRRTLNHYRVDQSDGALVLTLVEDEKLHDVLFAKIEALIV